MIHYTIAYVVHEPGYKPNGLKPLLMTNSPHPIMIPDHVDTVWINKTKYRVLNRVFNLTILEHSITIIVELVDKD